MRWKEREKGNRNVTEEYKAKKVGKHDRGEDMEGEHHQDEEGQSKREDHVQGSDSEKKRRVSGPSPTISSRAT